jgi:nitroimidazol reductase NimA-like FMN-containing flavoprotein (pyridoxamine 5'-phosphate oxidase superfamily)
MNTVLQRSKDAMRSMPEKEIQKFLEEWTWGTLIAVDGDRPYAIELSYATDGEYIYCGSMPGGRMARCIKDNGRVVFKVCDSAKDPSRFRAVIVEGTVQKLTGKEEIVAGLRVLYKKLGIPGSRIEPRSAQLIASGQSSFYRIAIQELGGRAIGY